MARALLIAEKPSVKNAVQIYIQKHGFKDQVDCFGARGHLIRMAEPNEYCDEWASNWNFNVLPMIPENLKFRFELSNDSDLQNRFNAIKRALKENHYDYIINACDSDREGEAIFWHIYNKANCTLPVKRYWENGTTDASISHALSTLRTYDDGLEPNLINLRTAAYLRGQFDWLVGMNFTRAASIAMHNVVKLGRVKTAVLWILVDLEKRIKNFKEVTSYRIIGESNVDNQMIEYKHVEQELNDKGIAKYHLITYEDKNTADYILDLLNKNKNCKVESIEKKEKKSKADKLYTLSDIQVEAATLHGLSVTESSEVMQSLYDKNVTTYPRTKNPYLSTTETTSFPSMLEMCKKIPGLESYANMILSNPDMIDKVKKDKSYVNDKETAKEGHCAIVPTGESFDYNSLSANEKALLKMVAERFLAIFLPNLIEEETTIIIKSNDEFFRTNFINTIDLGYTQIYGDKKRINKVPNIKEGDIFQMELFQMIDVVSTPPRRMSDAALVSAMCSPAKYLREIDIKMKEVLNETDGIGTESTRKDVLPQLAKDGYVEIKGKGNLLYPTKLGMDIIDNLGDMDITSVDLTAKWESKLEAIRKGEFSEDEFKREMLAYVKENVEIFKTANFNSLGKGKEERIIVGTCPSCGGTVYEGKNAYYCENFNGEADKCQVVLKKTIKGAKISLKNMQRILKGEISDAVKMNLEFNGQKYKSEKRFCYNPKIRKIEFYKPPIKEVGICPVCGKPLLENDKYVYCQDFGRDDEKCRVLINKEILGCKLSTADILVLLEGRESENIYTFVKKDKKKFDAKLKYDIPNKKLEFIFPPRKEAKDLKEVGTCPICGGKILGIYEGKFGPYYSCEKKCGLNISVNQGGVKLTEEDVKCLLDGKETRVFTMKSAKGTNYNATLYINKDTKKVDRNFCQFKQGRKNSN